MDQQNLPVMRYDLRRTDKQPLNSAKPALFYREVNVASSQEVRLTSHQGFKAPLEDVKEEEGIELNIEVHLPPKRTARAILHARHVGRAKPLVTLDFVDDEIMDW